jgi:hypothetical protein
MTVAGARRHGVFLRRSGKKRILAGIRLNTFAKRAISAAMSSGDDWQTRSRLAELQQRHRDLDDAIAALESADSRDQLQITRLKKEKLRLKDEISAVTDRLFPDIIA